MIGKSKSISHGINLLAYIMGESKNKEHPELIYHIKDNLLPSGLDAMGIWEQIKGEFYQFNLSSCIRQQNSLTAQFVSFSLANLANIFYPPRFLQ